MHAEKILHGLRWKNVLLHLKMQNMAYVSQAAWEQAMQSLNCFARVMKSLQQMICMEDRTACSQKYLHISESNFILLT